MPGRRRSNLAEYDLNKVLAETLDLVQHEARSRTNITIATAPCTGALPAQVDQDQMRQVFWNLATNAFDAMPKGGQLTIATGCRKVDVAGRKAEVVEVAFQDTGEGIPKKNLDKIFLPFFTTKKARLGIGFGRSPSHRRSSRRVDQSGKPGRARDTVWGLLAPYGGFRSAAMARR